MEHAPNRFSLKDCRLACAYDPHCLVWQAFPIEHGRCDAAFRRVPPASWLRHRRSSRPIRSCYQAYTGMNVTCHPPADGEARPSFMDGGRRAAFRTPRAFSRCINSDGERASAT